MKTVKRQGLILLVVLGMLALFSLLAVTYVVFAGQSRAASIAMARRDYRGTPPDRLLDQSLKQILRGTNDTGSALFTHGLLDDLYGAFEPAIRVRARFNNNDRPDRPKPGYMSPLSRPIAVNTDEGPRLYGGHLLKIPLEWQTELPEQHDSWTGRVLTFLSGPLAGQSLRIVRYVGEIDFSNVTTFQTYEPIQYSVLVDLSDIKDKPVTLGGTTRTISDWASEDSINGTALLYANYDRPANPTKTLTGPYDMLINAGEANSHGIGIDMGENAVAEGTASTTNIRSNKVPLLTYLKYPTDTLAAPFDTIYEAFLPNASYVKSNLLVSPVGDTDESYDAADFQNFFMTLLRNKNDRELDQDGINPAFHRQAIVNYITALAPSLSSITEIQMASLLELLNRATARPISYRIKNFPSNSLNAVNNVETIFSNPYFTGSNKMQATGSLGARSPQLQIDWANRNNSSEQVKFDSWVRWLTHGAWDVDNDGDGIKDSIWVDINMPLMTSSEGKLLKVLASFYVTDMDSKLDINASSSQAQVVPSSFTRYLPANDPRYAYNTNYPNKSYWPQGLGSGTADISLSHLFDGPDDFNYLLNRRYEGAGNYIPGGFGDDMPSFLLSRGRPANHSNAALPGLPKSMEGRMGLALDLLGNPILLETNLLPQTENDPYDSRILSPSHDDNFFSVAEWERIVRYNDLDRSTLPRGIEKATGSSLTVFSNISGQPNPNFYARARSISPRNVALTLPGFAGTYLHTRTTSSGPNDVKRRVSSFLQFVEGYTQKRAFHLPSDPPSVYFDTFATPYFSTEALDQLFPIEFHQNRPLNLNRATGDGIDNDGDGLVDERDELSGHGIANDPPQPTDNPSEIANLSQIHQRPRYISGLQNALEDYTIGAARFDNAHDPALLTPNDYVYYNGNQPKQLLARHLYCLAQLILPDDYEFPSQPTPTDSTERAHMRARMLAQWAVNVVDFRDADAAMTRFAYDAFPFKAKSVGGKTVYWNPTFWDPTDLMPPQPVVAGDGVVFGVEAPELLLTEAAAMHDMRIRRHSSPPPNTNSFQQLRVPEGSLFLEFFCPRSTDARGGIDNNLAGVPGPLYNMSSGPIALDLGLKTPKQMRDAGQNLVTVPEYPVWRVLLTKPDFNALNPSPYEQYRQKDTRYKYSYQIGAEAAGMPWTLNTPGSDPAIDRILWFTGSELVPDKKNSAFTALTNAEKKIYNRRSPDPVFVQGGQYLVVGPRPLTYFGSKVQASPPINKPNNHRIELSHNTGTRPNWVQIWAQNNDPGVWIERSTTNPPLPRTAADGDLPISPYIRQCVTMVAGSDAPASWPVTNPYDVNLPAFIGFNISEPTFYNDPTTGEDKYYPAPTSVLNSSDNATPSDTATGANGFNTLPPDAYIDLNGGSNNAPEPFDSDPNIGFLAASGWPNYDMDPDLRPQVASKDDWSTAILQRLADPSVPWHASLNPYITVDMIPIDLTVFSGELSLPPDDKNLPFKFATRQKTGATVRSTDDADKVTVYGKTFYSYNSETLADADANNALNQGLAYFDYELPLEVVGTMPPYPAPNARNAKSFSTLGYLNSRYNLRGYPGGGINNYVDDSTDPSQRRFQGAPQEVLALYHPNREFINSIELTSVPMSAPGTLMQEFTTEVPFDSTTASFDSTIASFGHTLDFEENGDSAVSGWTNRKKAAAILFQLMNVESPWPDAWKIENPATTQFDGSNSSSTTLQRNAMLAPYRAPYNFIPTFREPGRINLNTVTEPMVVRGLMLNAMTPNPSEFRETVNPIPFHSALELSRQGYPNSTVGAINPRLNSNYPTEFLGVFGSSLAIDKVPNATSVPLRTNSSVEASLLRHDIDIQNGTRGGRVFAPPAGAPNNSFLQYYPAARMANLTSDRSNVFAVRIVLGYFEYDSATGIGAEYGAEQGRARRNRGFYMLDRSIPVGYELGKDYNTDECILVRRVIE